MDRLTTLVEKFHLTVKPASPEGANLVAVASPRGEPGQVIFFTRGQPGACVAPVLMAVRVDWSGLSNRLMAALPDRVILDLAQHPDARALVDLIQSEQTGARCGAQSVINRLGEALMGRLLRDQIERGTAEIGLLAGLADPRLHRAIVSMHDHPGRLWTTADLADIAGLSRSRFAELFAAKVGETPIGYLRRWRLILARQDAARGDRIEAIARRYAYNSAESFTRAFRREYGTAPSILRGP